MNIQVVRTEHHDGTSVMIHVQSTSSNMGERLDKDSGGVPDATIEMLGRATLNAALSVDRENNAEAWLKATLLVLDNRSDREEFLELLYKKLR